MNAPLTYGMLIARMFKFTRRLTPLGGRCYDLRLCPARIA